VVPHSLLFNGYRGSFRGVKRSGCDAIHPPPPITKAEKVELYLYSPYAFMVWRGKNCIFSLFIYDVQSTTQISFQARGTQEIMTIKSDIRGNRKGRISGFHLPAVC